jgi:cytochrome bd-type quinol oxidase subunit 2
LAKIVFFIVYVVVLVFVLLDSSRQNKTYGKRFLDGFVFSAIIGPIYGLLNAIAQTAFPSITKETFTMFNSSSDIQFDSPGVRVGVFIGAFFGPILFNLIFGALWSSIFAAFIKPNEDAPVVAADAGVVTKTEPTIIEAKKEDKTEVKKDEAK